VMRSCYERWLLAILLFICVSSGLSSKQGEHEDDEPFQQKVSRCWLCKGARNLTDCVRSRTDCLSRQCYTYNTTEGLRYSGCGTCSLDYPPTCIRCKGNLCNGQANSGSAGYRLTFAFISVMFLILTRCVYGGHISVMVM